MPSVGFRDHEQEQRGPIVFKTMLPFDKQKASYSPLLKLCEFLG